MHRASGWAAIVLCLAACKKSASPSPAQPSPSPSRFCDQDLSGVWLNSSDKHFAYRFHDHGDVVRGEFQERSDDGGLANPSEPVSFELQRTKEALGGLMRSRQRAAGGHDCPVEFAIDVPTCGVQRFQAVVEMEAKVSDDCKRKTAEDGSDL